MQNIKTPSFTIYVQQFLAELSSVFDKIVTILVVFTCFHCAKYFEPIKFGEEKTTDSVPSTIFTHTLCARTRVFNDLDHFFVFFLSGILN